MKIQKLSIHQTETHPDRIVVIGAVNVTSDLVQEEVMFEYIEERAPACEINYMFETNEQANGSLVQSFNKSFEVQIMNKVHQKIVNKTSPRNRILG